MHGNGTATLIRGTLNDQLNETSPWRSGGEKINVGIFDRHLFFYGKSILDIYPSNW